MARVVADRVWVMHVNGSGEARVVLPRVLRAARTGAPYWAYYAGHAGRRGWRYLLPLGQDFGRPVLRLIGEVHNGELVLSCGHKARGVGAGGRARLGDEAVCVRCQESRGGWPRPPFQLIALEEQGGPALDARGQQRHILGKCKDMNKGRDAVVLLLSPFSVPEVAAAVSSGGRVGVETEGGARLLACGFEPPPSDAPCPVVLLEGDEGVLRWTVCGEVAAERRLVRTRDADGRPSVDVVPL